MSGETLELRSIYENATVVLGQDDASKRISLYVICDDGIVTFSAGANAIDVAIVEAVKVPQLFDESPLSPLLGSLKRAWATRTNPVA